MPTDTLQQYKILEIEPGASAERVRRAYIELTRTWDPARYDNNPVLREEAAKKRKEIDEAYKAIRFFLPELKDLEDETKKPIRKTRDFKELATGNPTLSIKAVTQVLLIIVLGLVIYFAYYLYQKGLRVTPRPVPITPTSVSEQ